MTSLAPPRQPVHSVTAGTLLALLACVAFLPSLRVGFINFDDPDYVTKNAHVQAGLTWEGLRWALTTGHASNWHPLTWLSHMLDCQWYGLIPWGHHLTNILLHAASTLVLFVGLEMMTGNRGPAVLITALFAVHPLRVESVVWISERKDVLSTLFWMLTILAYLRWARLPPSTSNRKKAWHYAIIVFLFALGLLSKPMLVTLPFVLLLLDFWPLQRLELRDLGKRVVEKLPLFALAAASIWITLRVQAQAMSSLERISIDDRLANAIVSICRYLGKLFWPSQLAVFYPRPTFWPTITLGSAVVLLLSISIAVALRWKRQPYLLVGWLWFLGTLMPVIGLVQVGDQAMADRYSYIPSVGLLMMIGWGFFDLAQHWRWPRLYYRVAGAVSVVLCFGLTLRQITFWKDSEILFRHNIAVTPPHYLMFLNLAIVLMEKHRFAESFPNYEKALELYPACADALQNYGVALAEAGQFEKALGFMRQAVSLRPEGAEARENLAMTLLKLGRRDESAAQYREILELNKTDAKNRYALACVLADQGQNAEAITHLREVVRARPDMVEAQINLATELQKTGAPDEAIAHWQSALTLQPVNSKGHNNLGILLAEHGKPDEAIAEFRIALAQDPAFEEAAGNLAIAQEMKRTAK